MPILILSANTVAGVHVLWKEGRQKSVLLLLVYSAVTVPGVSPCAFIARDCIVVLMLQVRQLRLLGAVGPVPRSQSSSVAGLD